ncbi:MAG: hypothetical protein LBQ55_08870 [Treponema sp.]|jgi:hypothetical protein|nr:hypothetical protein [Treponema sp.]
MAKKPPTKIRTAVSGGGEKGPLALIAVLLLSACAAEPTRMIILPPEQKTEPEQTETYTILDWQERTGGQDIPEWVRRFLIGGNREVEAMPQYRGRYVFVAASRGGSLEALQYWAGEFSDVQDFPRLVAVRIEERLAGAAVLYPDDEYGEFFEVMVKRASDASYHGARRETSFWMRRQLHDGDDENEDPEVYDCFVLVSIDREELAGQIRPQLANPRGVKTPTRDQAAAVDRIRETFFDGF